MQQKLVKAASGPLATKQRAAIKATSEAQQRLDKVQGLPQGSDDEPPPLGPTPSPTDTSRLEQAAVAAQAASQELERISAHREQVAQSIRTISKAYHFVDLERGVRRNAPLIAADIQAQVDQVRAIAQHQGLSQGSLDRIDKAQRVVPKMQAMIAFVSGYVAQQISQLDLPLPVSYAMHAHRPCFPARTIDSVVLSRAGGPGGGGGAAAGGSSTAG